MKIPLNVTERLTEMSIHKHTSEFYTLIDTLKKQRIFVPF